MKRPIIFALLAVLFPIRGNCWWSLWTFEDSTHYKITQQAINALPESEYPDIRRFSGIITEATSGKTDDANAHGRLTDAEVGYTGHDDAGEFNGGNFNIWWDNVQFKYRKSHFIGGGFSAYYYIALMAHLVEDQAVPAHAANIYHASTLLGVPTNTDDMESWADGREPGYFTPASYGKEPLSYYYDPRHKDASVIHETQSKLSGLRYPAGGPIPELRELRYWKANTNQPYYGQAFAGDFDNPGPAGGWGNYGGPGGDDIYQHWYQPNWYLPPVVMTMSSEIGYEQLNEAASYTAGMLMAVSKSLPPLVQSPAINDMPVSDGPATISPAQPNTIKFTLLENRAPIVTYRLVVDSIDGAPIIYSDEQSVTLAGNGDPASLPFLDIVTSEWDGLLATGAPIPALPEGGPHTLYIVGKDLDGNDFNSVIGSFNIAGGPYITVASPMGTPYVRFSGVSSLTPGLVNIVDTVDWVNIPSCIIETYSAA